MKVLYRVYKNKIGDWHCERHAVVGGDENSLYLKVHGSSKPRVISKMYRFDEMNKEIVLGLVNGSFKEAYFRVQPDMEYFDPEVIRWLLEVAMYRAKIYTRDVEVYKELLSLLKE